MYHTLGKIVLASASPRRQSYLSDLGIDYTVSIPAIDEEPRRREPSFEYVARMAEKKARAVQSSHPQAWIIGADTIICFEDRILGKPKDVEHAVSMLLALSGKEHSVISGVSVVNIEKRIAITRVVTTAVQFAPFNEIKARAYIACKESMDKAGAYAIQGKGACLVEAINGSYSNVVGLPLTELLQILEEQRVIAPRDEGDR
jgi:septum formation protein